MKTITNKHFYITAAVALALTALTSEASLRPVGDAVQLAELQGVFDSIGATSIDAVNDQINEMAFEPTSPNVSSEFVASASWSAGSIDFGIYNLANISQKVSLFDVVSNTDGDTTILQFNLAGNYVRSVDADTLSIIDSTTFFLQFGFYATSYQGTFYSEDDLNSGSHAHFLSYQSEGDNVTIGGNATFNDIGHYYIAAEVGDIDTTLPTADFSDIVVQVESILPIPEPASMGLIALFTGGIYFTRRFFPQV
jgi:hypothetical protein